METQKQNNASKGFSRLKPTYEEWKPVDSCVSCTDMIV